MWHSESYSTWFVKSVCLSVTTFSSTTLNNPATDDSVLHWLDWQLNNRVFKSYGMIGK